MDGGTHVSIQTMVTWIVVLGGLVAVAKPLGIYIVRVFTFQPTWLDRPLGRLEDRLFQFMGIDRDSNMSAKEYSFSLLLTNLAWMLAAYLALRWQYHLPFNPEHLRDLKPTLAFNTAASFVTNTDWQAYSGATTLSYFSQFAVLSYLQFVAPAAGGAVGIAFLRSISGRQLGNFFVDLTLMVTRLLLPLAVIGTVLLVAQGVPETLKAYLHVHTITGLSQWIPRGPIASFESIEHLGQDGGGYFAANSASPLENPTALSNLIEILSMGLLPLGFFYAFGAMTGKRRFAWTLIGVAGTFFIGMLALVYFPELAGNPLVNSLGLHGMVNMVGKEIRLGLGGTSLFETSSMAFATGSVVSAHDSYLPLSTLSFYLGMFLNVVFGGQGVGILNMLMFVILTTFLMGLMVGRTPEFLGKKIEAREVSIAALAFLIHPALILIGSAIAVATQVGQAGIFNPGPQGLSEIFYAFASAAANNGSALAGLKAALPFYEVILGVVAVIGRYVSMMAMLFIGQSLLTKRSIPESQGTLRADTPVFAVVLLGSIVVLNALTFFPIMALAPIAEQYLMLAHHLVR